MRDCACLGSRLKNAESPFAPYLPVFRDRSTDIPGAYTVVAHFFGTAANRRGRDLVAGAGLFVGDDRVAHSMLAVGRVACGRWL